MQIKIWYFVKIMNKELLQYNIIVFQFNINFKVKLATLKTF